MRDYKNVYPGEAVNDLRTIVTAEDVVDILREKYGDYSFCCPLIGLYPCERHRRGCYCHELHLQNYHAALEQNKAKPAPYGRVPCPECGQPIREGDYCDHVPF